MEHFPIKVIQWVAWSIIMAIIFAIIVKSRKKDLLTNTTNNLSLPTYVFIIGLVDFCFFLAIALISNIFPNGTESIATTLIFLGFSLLGLLLIYMYYIEKFSYNSTEINYTKFNGRKIKIDLSTVNSIKYQASMQWIVITYNETKKSYFATMLKGIKPFSEMILKNINHKKIDENTLLILNRIKNGEVV